MISNVFFQNFVDLEAGVCTDDEDSNDREYIEEKNEDSLEGTQDIIAL